MPKTTEIVKNLKYYSFIYDDETQKFSIIKKSLSQGTTDYPIILEINKTYAFALLRFLIRISQRNWFRKHKKVVKEKGGEEE